MFRKTQRQNSMRTWIIHYTSGKSVKTKEVTAISYNDSGEEFKRVTKLPISLIIKRIKHSQLNP